MNSLKKPSIFFSSTIDDFREARSYTKWFFENNGYDFFISEDVKFPIGLNDKHPFLICYDQIRRSDLVLHRIGLRLGYETTWKDHKVSISMAEYLCALDEKKPVYVYCDETVKLEREIVKTYARKHKIPQSKAFEDLRECINPIKTESFKVFKNFDYICKNTKSAWIKFYSDGESLLNAIATDMSEYNVTILSNGGVPNTALVNLIRRGGDDRFVQYNSEYDPTPETAKLLIEFYDRITNLGISNKLYDAEFLQRTTHQFNQNLDDIVHTGLSSGEAVSDRGVFFAIETTIEHTSTDFWDVDQKMETYLQLTKQFSKKLSRGSQHFYRIFLFSKKQGMENTDKLRSIALKHLSNGITPIFATYMVMVPELRSGLINSNGILGKRVDVMSFPFGLMQSYNLDNNSYMVLAFSQSVSQAIKACAFKKNAFTLDGTESDEKVLELVNGLNFS